MARITYMQGGYFYGLFTFFEQGIPNRENLVKSKVPKLRVESAKERDCAISTNLGDILLGKVA